MITEQSVGQKKQKKQPHPRKNAAYNIVSIVAFLIGIDQSVYEGIEGYISPQIEMYKNLNKNKNARIIRNLSIVRNGIEKNYTSIIRAFLQEFKNIGTVPDYISTAAIKTLEQDGIILFKSRPDINQYLIEINSLIANRINNVKSLFPEWLKWEYVRALFIMPNGQKVEGIKAAGNEYNSNRNRYPYQCYINWEGGDCGNILYSDEKFATLLYQTHEDYFENLSLVRDASAETYNNIYHFIESSSATLIVVDCENSDPIKLAACLSGLASRDIGKIHKVLLVDSDYTTSGWGLLGKIPNLPIDHIKIPRIVDYKSQVDMALAARTCQEVYKNRIDSVVLVSSDSDYWALIQTLSDVDFLVLAETKKCGTNLQAAMTEKGIPYCFIDEFCTHASYTIKTDAMTSHIQSVLDDTIKLNAKELVSNALKATWMNMTQKEYDAFYKRYLLSLKVSVDDDGNIRLIVDP